MIEVILQDGDHFITAGRDGYIKWWKVSEVDSAEGEEGPDVAIAPVREIPIAENENGDNPACIVNMISANNKWYIQDANGRIYVMAHDSEIVHEITSFHKGSVNDLVCSPSHNYAISLGQDGTVKVWDYANKSAPYEYRYSGSGTCLEHMPFTEANKGRVCAIGFDNGIVRIVSVTADGLVILKAFKAHDDAIIRMQYSADLKLLCTASAAGDIFFFEISALSDVQRYEPLCCLKLPDNNKITDFKWTADDNSVIFGCASGYVYEVARPDPKKIDNSDSFLWENPGIKTWWIQIMDFQMEKNQKKDEAEEERKRRMRLRGELPPEELEPEEVWDPEPIRTILPFKDKEGNKRFIISSEGKFNSWIYVCDMDTQRPLRAIEIKPNVFVTKMNL